MVKKSITFIDTRILSLETQALLLSLCVIIVLLLSFVLIYNESWKYDFLS